MIIVLLGPPGAGKGTQAHSICDRYGVPHISTGDIFVDNIRNETELGVKAKGYINAGLLVPDSITLGLVKDRLEKEDTMQGFLLDGFPRTIPQAMALDALLLNQGRPLDFVLHIHVPKTFVLQRMPGRRVCSRCGASYHLEYKKPRIADRCDRCGSSLIQRKDDRVETVEERYRVYMEQTHPLLEYYAHTGALKKVDGTQSIAQVWEEIQGILSQEKVVRP